MICLAAPSDGEVPGWACCASASPCAKPAPQRQRPAPHPLHLLWGGSTPQVYNPIDGCTYTYKMVEGAFGGQKPGQQQPGTQAQCGARGGQQLTASSMCALCAAGSYAVKAPKPPAACTQCKSGSVAAAAGATSCRACPQGMWPSGGLTACMVPGGSYYRGLLAGGNYYPDQSSKPRIW